MYVAGLGVLYAVGGVVCAAVLRRSWLDTLILLVCWPLYAPFCVREPTPLGFGDLMEAEDARRLQARIAAARARAARVDEALASPDLDAAAIRTRAASLRAAGHEAAAAVAERSLHHVERLGAVRQRCAAELAEIDELLRQLRAQALVLELSGGSAASLVGELLLRVDALDETLAEVT